MKTIFTAVIFVIVFMGSICVRADRGYEEHRLRVKFLTGSDIAQSWQTGASKGQIEEFVRLLGKHKSSSFINPGLIRAYTRKLDKNKMYRSAYDQVSSLYMICDIEYESDIDPQAACGKLSSRPDVIYAEPVPIHKFSVTPNDSLFKDQYYLGTTKVFEALELINPQRTVLVGVVDTGVDYDHEDLKGQMYENPGENGLDFDGNDKKSNGIDDDDNGFIDDWRGWDFMSSVEPGYDNDPYPGHGHGTHISGVIAALTNNEIGIAGIADFVKIIPVKIGKDNPTSTSVHNSYQGILYAAVLGAEIINCSWVSTTKSEAEEEIVIAAEKLGALIIGAAGNDFDHRRSYPASYGNSISVAATDKEDRKTTFSNYDETVDLSAPGDNIMSTLPLNNYAAWDGTSMATPVVVGIAAILKIVYPDYSPVQLAEHLKLGTDDINNINPAFYGLIGSGRINALKAVELTNPRSVIIEDYTIIDENGDAAYELGEKIEIEIELLNVLAPSENIRVVANFSEADLIDFDQNEILVGAMYTLESLTPATRLTFTVPSNISTDSEKSIYIKIYDGDDKIGTHFIPITLRPSYKTMTANNLSVTFNSRGNIAYNDYPANTQGSGFRYLDGNNLLYEGALMIASGYNRVSDVARIYAKVKNNDFQSDSVFAISKPGLFAAQEGNVNFREKPLLQRPVGVKVRQTVYQFDKEPDRNYIIIEYNVVNVSGADFDSLCVALYGDWDLGPQGYNNVATFDKLTGLAYVKNATTDSLPQIGMSLLSEQALNFFAVDNDGVGYDNPGVWDSFEDAEKWRMMSGGVARSVSNITDVSTVIAAGPIQLPAADSVKIVMSIFVADNLTGLREQSDLSRIKAKEIGIADSKYMPVATNDTLMSLYPNPADDVINIEYSISEEKYISIYVYNSLGQKVAVLVDKNFKIYGHHKESYNLQNLAIGRYYLEIYTFTGSIIQAFEIVR
ncbi:MAG: S8 family serine peptidase [Candidatus Kapabacteria bacterium]|jgi:serine protease|nr:S8 family serine peptidase [Candidatus Kapabacteria bacterium]